MTLQIRKLGMGPNYDKWEDYDYTDRKTMPKAWGKIINEIIREREYAWRIVK